MLCIVRFISTAESTNAVLQVAVPDGPRGGGAVFSKCGGTLFGGEDRSEHSGLFEELFMFVFLLGSTTYRFFFHK